MLDIILSNDSVARGSFIITISIQAAFKMTYFGIEVDIERHNRQINRDVCLFFALHLNYMTEISCNLRRTRFTGTPKVAEIL